MEWMQWLVVGVLVAISAGYSVWRLLPRRKGQGGGCGGCASQTPPAASKR